MKAFLEQTDIDSTKNDARNAAIAKIQEAEYNKALKQLAKSGDIISSIINDGGLNNKSEIHPQFRNYDHSLEMDRVLECQIKKENYSPEDHNDFRPVEKDGEIVMEPTATIEELLKKT